MRLPSTGPAFHTCVAGTYASRTMSATFETSSHQASASPPVNGLLFTSRIGCAPSHERCCSNERTFDRYCAFELVQGVAVLAPYSSFSTITGVLHSVWRTAKSYSFCAFATIVAESAGAVGVPIRLFMCRSK